MSDTIKKEIDFYDFAFCGTKEGFARSIENLAAMAEEEIWTVTDDKNGILRKYFLGTFNQCYKQNKFLVTADNEYTCFNTGLMTPNGNDILCVFQKNKKAGAQPWFLKYFLDKTDRKYMDLFSKVPELATYTNNYEEFYFNPNLTLTINSDHILDDHWERIHEVVPLSKNIVKALIEGAIEETKRKIKRNLRLVVPQFYNNQIMYLVPIQIPIDDEKTITMALAVELTQQNQYRANTIFTKEMAYEKARLLMKPESNWLI